MNFLIVAVQKLSAQDHDFNVTCLGHLNDHIQTELQASVTYLTMVNPISIFLFLFCILKFF